MTRWAGMWWSASQSPVIIKVTSLCLPLVSSWAEFSQMFLACSTTTSAVEQQNYITHTIKLSHLKSIQIWITLKCGKSNVETCMKMSTKHNPNVMLWLFMTAIFVVDLRFCCHWHVIATMSACMPYTVLSILCHTLSCSCNYGLLYCLWFWQKWEIAISDQDIFLCMQENNTTCDLKQSHYCANWNMRLKLMCFGDCMDKH